MLPVGEGVELVDEALGVHPAQRVPVERELAGVVGEDHRVGQQPVGLDAAPHRPLGRDPDRIGRDRQRRRCRAAPGGRSQAASSAKCRSACSARRAITGPASARWRM